MARKVLFDSNHSLVSTVQRLNQMGDWMGDLDDLTDSTSYILGFQSANRDNDLVDAANYLHNNVNILREALFGPDSADSGDSGRDRGTLRFEKVLVADSAVIQRLQLGQLLSPVDSATIVRDSLDSSYAFPPYDQRHFGGPPHQLHVTIDSGYIRDFHGSYLRVGKWLYIDSDLNKFYDSGVDSINNWDTNFDSNYGFGLIVDSANIVRLSSTWQKFPYPHPRRYVGDSGYTDSSSLYFDSAYIKRLSYIHDSNDSSTLDSVWTNAIAAIDSSREINMNSFILDFESSYDSVNFGFIYDSTDSDHGVPYPYFTGNAIGRYNYHDKLNVDSPFRFTSLLEVYTDSIDLSFQPIRKIGGYLVSQYDSDDRI
jgi:hypothetical protein